MSLSSNIFETLVCMEPKELFTFHIHDNLVKCNYDDKYYIEYRVTNPMFIGSVSLNYANCLQIREVIDKFMCSVEIRESPGAVGADKDLGRYIYLKGSDVAVRFLIGKTTIPPLIPPKETLDIPYVVVCTNSFREVLEIVGTTFVTLELRKKRHQLLVQGKNIDSTINTLNEYEWYPNSKIVLDLTDPREGLVRFLGRLDSYNVMLQIHKSLAFKIRTPTDSILDHTVTMYMAHVTNPNT